MDKNEYNQKLAEIRRDIEQGNYAEAVKAADMIDWRKVRNVNTLCMISEVYEAENRFEDSKELLLRAHRRSPMSRTVLYRLVEVTIKLKQFDEAIQYYTDYVQASPNDNSRYILKYKIYRGRGSSVNEQIDILREYLDLDYDEKYAYELARLYQQADRMEECIAACDDLVLWFHSGKYVIKALELKKRYAALTPKQQLIYDSRFDMVSDEPAPLSLEPENLGQEREIVSSQELSLADSIVEDTEKSIAREMLSEAMLTDAGEENAGKTDTKQFEANVNLAAPSGADGEVQITAEAESAAQAGTENAALSAAGIEKAAQAGAEGAELQQVMTEGAELQQAMTEGAGAVEAPAAETEGLQRTVPKTPEQQRDEMAASMREVFGNVGKMEYSDPDQEMADQLIEESKKEQEAARMGLRIPTLRMPDLQKKHAAGQLTLDDVLQSMGEKGSVVRETASRSQASYVRGTQPAGVLSAVDEALLSMGYELTPERDDKAQETQMGSPAGSLSQGGTGEQSTDQELPVREREMISPRALAESREPSQIDLPEALARNRLDVSNQSGAGIPFGDEGAIRDAEESAPGAGELPREFGEDASEAEVSARDALNSDAEDIRIADKSARPWNQSGGNADQTMEDIINAKTKVIPSEEIGRRYRSEGFSKEELGLADDASEDSKFEQISRAVAEVSEKIAVGEKLPEEPADSAAGEKAAEPEIAAGPNSGGFVVGVVGVGERAAGESEPDGGEAPEEIIEAALEAALAEEIIKTAVEAEAVSGAAETAEQAGDVVSESAEAAGEAAEIVPDAGQVAEEAAEAVSGGAEAAGEAAEAVSESAEAAGEAAEAVSESAEAAGEAAEVVSETGEAAVEDIDSAASESENRENPAGEEGVTGESAVEESAVEESVVGEPAVEEISIGDTETADMPQEEADAIPEPKPHIYILKPDLRGLFEGYLEIGNLDAQLHAAIAQAVAKQGDRTSRTGNILIFGGHGCGKTTLAMGLAKAIAKENQKGHIKMARIYATDLNRKDIAATVAKIAGGILIVEEAGDLDDSVADQLTTAMEFRTDGLIVIFEDEQKYLHELLMRHPRLTMKFTSEVYIPKLTARELAGFAQIYADDNDCVLSEGAMRLLTEKIENMLSREDKQEEVSISTVLEMVDNAMTKASTFVRKLFGGKKRVDDQGRVILREKDFA